MGAELQNYVLKTLDNPVRVLFWGVDEFIVMVFPSFLAMAVGVSWLMLTGLLTKYLYNKLKKKFPNSSLRHCMYWNLPKEPMSKMGWFKTLPPSYWRKILL